ncbi:MAG: hypothetical protein ACRD1K_17645, partial [Acidimicrobiales bacterium]
VLLSVAPVAAGTTLEVAFRGVDPVFGGTEADGILCSTIGVGEIVVSENGVDVPTTVTCSGTADRSILLTRVAGTWTAGTTIRVRVVGSIADQSGNASPVGTITGPFVV